VKDIAASVIIFFIGIAVSAQTICTNSDFRANLATNSIDLDRLQLPNSQLFLIGEAHFQDDSQIFTQIISTFSAQMNSEKCVFLELASSHPPEEFIQKVTDALKEDLSSEERADADEFLRHFRPIIEIAKKSGFNIFTVDHPENFGQGIDINVRDVAIAQNLEKLLSTQCRQAIMFVGKAHISADEQDRTKLSDLLRARKVSFTTFNLQHASDIGPDKLASWDRLCHEPILNLNNRTFVFSNDGIKKQTPLWPLYIGGNRLQGLWSDFDLTILTP
jgi:hypothetical protein